MKGAKLGIPGTVWGYVSRGAGEVQALRLKAGCGRDFEVLDS